MLNKHIELVKAWLADRDSFTEGVLRENAYQAQYTHLNFKGDPNCAYFDNLAYTYSYYASRASYYAYHNQPFSAEHFVSCYERESKSCQNKP